MGNGTAPENGSAPMQTTYSSSAHTVSKSDTVPAPFTDTSIRVVIEPLKAPASQTQIGRLEDGLMYLSLLAFVGAALAFRQSVIGDNELVFLVIGTGCLVVLFSTQLWVRLRKGAAGLRSRREGGER